MKKAALRRSRGTGYLATRKAYASCICTPQRVDAQRFAGGQTNHAHTATGIFVTQLARIIGSQRIETKNDLICEPLGQICPTCTCATYTWGKRQRLRDGGSDPKGLFG